MRTAPPKDERDERRKRATYAMDLAMAARKLSQAALAEEIGVSPQYLSDVKNGHRSLTDPFAHRLAEVSDVSFVWLMHGEGQPVRTQPTPATGGAVQVLALPVLSAPCAGEPRKVEGWDGSLLEVTGSASALALKASFPYLLRLPFDVPACQLRKGDALLMSQEKKTTSHGLVVVARTQEKDEKGDLVLARRTPKGGLVSAAHGDPIRGDVEEVGQCLGLVWRAM